MTTVCTAETGSHRFCRHRWRLGEWTDTLNCHVLPLCSLYMRPDAEPRRSASAGSRSTFIPDLTEAARPLQEANNTQVDSNAQCASFWIFWSWNPFALATGSGAQWGPPKMSGWKFICSFTSEISSGLNEGRTGGTKW